MISFAHFDNFDKKMSDFKNGSEKEKSEFDSFMLAFSFATTTNDLENPKFEFNSNAAEVAAGTDGDTSVFPDESARINNDFREIDEVFLPNDEAAVSSDKAADWGKFQSNFFSDKKNILKAEAFADLQNFVKTENLSPGEIDFVNKTVAEKFSQSKSPDLNIVKEDTLQTEVEKQTEVENSTDSIVIRPEIKSLKDLLPIRPASEVSVDSNTVLPIENETLPTSFDQSEFHVEMALDIENIDLNQDLNFKIDEQTNPISMKNPDFDQLNENQKSEQPKDSVLGSGKKTITEAEIEQIMESKFLASEIEQNESAIDNSPLNTAEKINLWQFKSPEFQDYKNISEIISKTADVPEIEPAQDLKHFEIVNTDGVKDEDPPVTSDILKTENSYVETKPIINSELEEVNDPFDKSEPILQEKIRQPEQNSFQTNDAEIFPVKTPTESPINLSNEVSTPATDKSSNEFVLEIPQNVIETERYLSEEHLENPPMDKIEILPNDTEPVFSETQPIENNFETTVIDDGTITNNEIDSGKIINNKAEKLAEGDTNVPFKNDPGERMISNLSNRPPVANFPQDREFNSVEKVAGNLSNITPQPVHRQDSEEINAVNVSKKFPKLIREVSQYFGEAKPFTKTDKINSGKTENLLNTGDMEVPVAFDAEYVRTDQGDVPVAESPEIVSFDDPTQDTGISQNNSSDDIAFFEGKAELQIEKPIQLRKKADSGFEINSPDKNLKPQTEPPKPQMPGKKAEVFRVNNGHIEGGNWAEVKVENQNLGEQKEINEQIELPVFEQVENPILEYLTSDEGIERPEILKLRLRPAELGTVEVRLEKHISGKLEVHFQAENEQAKQVLAESFEKLRESLQNNGWQIGRLEISNSLLSSNGFKNGGDNPSGSETPQSYNDKTDNAGGFSEENDDPNQNEPDRLVNLRA